MSKLPSEVVYSLKNLPPQGQLEFMDKYKVAEKHISIAYLCHFFGISYAYQGKWGKQLLCWLTFYGFGIWWFVNLFRLPFSIEAHNRRESKRIIKKILRKYGKLPHQNNFQHPFNKIEHLEEALTNLRPQPRPMNIEFDPSNLGVENLKTGYLVDYEMKTWIVSQENQYDFQDSFSEKEFRLSAESSQTEVLYVQARNENNFATVWVGKMSNIHKIDTALQSYIVRQRQAPNIIKYKNLKMFRESYHLGTVFCISNQEVAPRKVQRWEFLDENRNVFLRIEWLNEKEFQCYEGRIISKQAFSDILPSTSSMKF
ncbi:MAG: hypothetical protein OHK0038_05210 [Flammeovirgaceae bacterium]